MPIKEEWRVTPDWPLFEASNLGRVRKGTKIKRQTLNHGGYLVTGVTDGDGVYKVVYVHRLVASAFLDNPKNKSDINHKDSDRQNNLVTNLEWATRSENITHGYLYGNVRTAAEYTKRNKNAKQRFTVAN